MKATPARFGVNIGGWFITESWITPSLYKNGARNEFELTQTSEGRKLLNNHVQTYITEADVKWLVKKGITIIRIPIAHWMFDETSGYYATSLKKLDWFISVCERYGIDVLLDLHAAPGGQNNADHSGVGNIAGRLSWLKNRYAQNETIKCLVKIAKRYSKRKNIWGIELLNEPTPGIFGIRLTWFYRRAYFELIKVARAGTRIVFSDGYKPFLFTNALSLIAKPSHPVVMDSHFYQCFGQRAERRSLAKHLKMPRRIARFITLLQLSQPLVVGEWSAMLPIKVAKDDTQAFIAAQLEAYDQTEAIFYWNYKTEADGRWNFRDMVEKGYFDSAVVQ